MPIKFKLDQSKDLSIFLVEGPVTHDEVHAAIKRFYESTYPPPTKNILWDLRSASVNEIGYEEAQELAFFATSSDHRKEIGRTAIVASEDVVFGVSRMFGAFINDNAVTFEVFRDFDEAYKWVAADDDRIDSNG
jgi:hypothetical protein